MRRNGLLRLWSLENWRCLFLNGRLLNLVNRLLYLSNRLHLGCRLNRLLNIRL